MTRTVAVLPVKTFALAKQRIAVALGPRERVALVEAMLEAVLDALAAVDALDSIVVVTVEPRAAVLAARAGAQVIAEPPEPGHSPAAAAGAHWAQVRGADRVLLVAGDCPAMDPAEVEQLLATPPGKRVVVVPDRHGTGTNALLLSPPDVMEPSFGEGSCARHVAIAEAAGAEVSVVDLPSLAFDVDTPEDLAISHALQGRV